MTGLRLPACALLLATAAAGCWVSKFEGEQMQAAGRARDARLQQLEERTRGNHQELDEKVAELEDVLERATQILQRDSADVGAQIETIQSQVSTLEGQMAELRHMLETFRQEQAEARVGTPTGGAAPPARVPEDRSEHFTTALRDFQAESYSQARTLFLEYIKRYPNDARTGEAQYWVAASYLQENKPATALGEYRKVISAYPKSTAVNVALYGMGDAFYRLHACTDAKAALDALLKRKPERDLVRRTQELLKTVRKAPKSYCTS